MVGEIKSTSGDSLYHNQENAISSFRHLVKPQNYSLVYKDGKYLVTTNRRSTLFKKLGWKLVGYGSVKGKGIHAIEIPFRRRS